jgi:GNAT superfamily N-acetyltransferase
MASLEVQPLTPERWDDVAALFGEGGDPRFCWCMYWRLRSRDFGATHAGDNRDGLRALTVLSATTGGPAPGLIAYRGGRPVGWVSLGPRESFARLEHSRTIPRHDDMPIWSIVCFVVSRRVRGNGIARQLLEAAIVHARKNDASALEAYPIATEGARLPSASLWTGTLGTFEQAGFKVVGSRLGRTNTPTPSRPIVRLELG